MIIKHKNNIRIINDIDHDLPLSFPLQLPLPGLPPPSQEQLNVLKYLETKGIQYIPTGICIKTICKGRIPRNYCVALWEAIKKSEESDAMKTECN